MNLSESTNDDLLPNLHHFDVEDQTRLLKQLNRNLGVNLLTDRDRQIAHHNIKHGLRYLATTNSHANEWSEIFGGLATLSSASTDTTEVLDAAPHPILQLMVEQPANSRSPEERRRCLAVGAKILMATGFHLQNIPTTFLLGLRQLFRSEKQGWVELCGVDFLDAEKLRLWNPVTQVATIHACRDFLLNLTQVSIPPAGTFLKSAPTRANSITSAEPSKPYVSTSHTEDEQQRDLSEKKPDDTTPHLKLFEVQKQRDCQADIVDGYRIPFHWGRLCGAELKICLENLNLHLKNKGQDSESRQRRVHAAFRYVSLFCGMSLKKCLRLPLGRRGSMKLDIFQGVIRRDILAIAPRMDRKDRRRMNGRYWRTRFPQEVIEVLQECIARHPECATLGELLHAEGLVREACQRMLNDNWPSSHCPEDSRFSLSLRPCLLDLGVHPALVARITGDTMTTPASDHYYLSFSEQQVHEGICKFYVWAGLTPPPPPVRNRTIGSPKALSKKEFASLITKLNQIVLTARNLVTPKSSISEVIKFHNTYTEAVALVIIWCLGGRGDRISSLTYERIFASEEFVVLSDRRVDRYSRQRTCPATQLLKAIRRQFLEHLRSISQRLGKLSDVNSEIILEHSTGQRPHQSAFTVFAETPEGWKPRSLNRKDLVKLAKQLGVEDLNVARHFWYSELVSQNVSQIAIEALLGHHQNGSEAFGYGSGISVRKVCDYLRPLLEDIQNELGFTPLIGCGRQNERYLTLPELSVKNSLRPLPNVLLTRKLEVQEFLIPEATIYEQDPPSHRKTLTSHSHLERLTSLYCKTDLVASHPLGASLFCLIGFEVVLAQPEQVLLLDAGLSTGLIAIGRLAVVEAKNEVRAVLQRVVCQHTVAAFSLAKKSRAPTIASYIAASEDLHKLLHKLDPGWPAQDPDASVKLLATMTSHWAAVEIAPAALFGAFHKAPFIPAAHLARLYHGRPCMEAAASRSSSSRRHSTTADSFDRILEIVRHWGDKDLELGGEHARRKSCIEELHRFRTGEALDEMEQLFIDLLVADLSPDAPFNTLNPAVLLEYARGYVIYFRRAKQEGSVEMDPESFLSIYLEMGGTKEFALACPARWQMLHICSFLKLKNYSAPAGFLSVKAMKTPVLPRMVTYTSPAEIAASCTLLKNLIEWRGGTFCFASCRLQLQRGIPLRVSEIRYLKPRDVDVPAKLIHITETGHDHLKTSASMGSAPLTDPLADSLLNVRDRRLAIFSGAHALLFADVHLPAPYTAFDQVSNAMRDCVVNVTGCHNFRQHDLRAAAATDIGFDVMANVKRLGDGIKYQPIPLSGAEVTTLHSRIAKSSRLSRHGSELTTLRYYNCASMLDLRCELEAAQSRIYYSGSYLAALQGKKIQSVFAANYRRGHTKTGSKTKSPLTQLFDEHYFQCIKSLPTPTLGDAPELQDTTPPASPQLSRVRMLQARLLMALGLPPATASDALQLPPDTVLEKYESFSRKLDEIGIRFAKNDHPPITASTWSADQGVFINNLHKYASWLAANESMAAQLAVPLLPSFHWSGSRLVLKNEVQLTALFPLLKSLRSAGFRVVFRPGHECLLSVGIRSHLDAACIEVHKINATEQVYGVISFLLDVLPQPVSKLRGGKQKILSSPFVAKTVAPEAASPRSYGRAGRLVVAGLLVCLSS